MTTLLALKARLTRQINRLEEKVALDRRHKDKRLRAKLRQCYEVRRWLVDEQI